MALPQRLFKRFNDFMIAKNNPSHHAVQIDFVLCDS